MRESVNSGQTKEKCWLETSTHIPKALFLTLCCFLCLLHGLCSWSISKDQAVEENRPFIGRVYTVWKVKPSILLLDPLRRFKVVGFLIDHYAAWVTVVVRKNSKWMRPKVCIQRNSYPICCYILSHSIIECSNYLRTGFKSICNIECLWDRVGKNLQVYSL